MIDFPSSILPRFHLLPTSFPLLVILSILFPQGQLHHSHKHKIAATTRHMIPFTNRSNVSHHISHPVALYTLTNHV
jgi:hypothetical protein